MFLEDGLLVVSRSEGECVDCKQRSLGHWFRLQTSDCTNAGQYCRSVLPVSIAGTLDKLLSRFIGLSLVSLISFEGFVTFAGIYVLAGSH